ncbi:MAG: hypothetical protein R2941_16135 [Desulfobacterales bacterium]
MKTRRTGEDGGFVSKAGADSGITTAVKAMIADTSMCMNFMTASFL